MESSTIFYDSLSKSKVYGNIPLYVLARLFESFREQSLSDVCDRRSDDVSELSIRDKSNVIVKR